MLPFTIQATQPSLITIPYHPILGDSIPMADEQVCQLEARFGAKALQNALRGELLAEQLAVWDAFTASASGTAYSPYQLQRHRELISIAWHMSAKFTDLEPNDFGDYVYNSCVYRKLSKTVTF
jgi:hypothetical protein